MAATALALRLYEVDHGARPGSLSDLVPEYLPTLPLDPFDPAARSLQYLPEGAGARLYSVGKDGRDDGGAYALRATGDIDPDQKDLPFFLDGLRPHRTARATAPARTAATNPTIAASIPQTVDDDGPGRRSAGG